MSFHAIRKNKILAKISEFTVLESLDTSHIAIILVIKRIMKVLVRLSVWMHSLVFTLVSKGAVLN